ncbi:MAG: aspartate-alanine antiporter [Coprothermobacterota bacterium]|nr:aspartate-alanine antiporter [Coprothermobacterota bacterium]
MGEINKIVQSSPELLIFLALAIGYSVGKIKIKGFGLGTTASVLLAAMFLGQIGITVPAILKDISFALFAFCIGYQVGPQFFGSLRKEGLRYLWISLLVALVGLGTAILLGKAFQFDAGTTAGLFAGSMTQSAVIGTAQGAVAHLPISDAAKAILDGNIAVAYAITYIFGTIGVIFFFKLLPGILRINLKQEAKKLGEQMGGISELSQNPALFSWSAAVALRAFELTNPRLTGKQVNEIEALFSTRVEVDSIKRGSATIEPTADTVVESGDILVISGLDKSLLNAPALIGPEVDVSEVAEVVGESLKICVLNRAFTGKTLADWASSPVGHGLFLRRITRGGRELPITPDTVINKCDVVHVLGIRDDVERVAKILGYPQRPSASTDLVMVGAGCALGTLLGMIVISAGRLPLTLGVGGGVLVAGLFFGWLRSVHPTFGQIPDAGQWILTDLGLNLFIACIGLAAGKQAVQALQTNGGIIFLAGVILALVPLIAGVIFGKYALRMNPILLLGALTGARVIPPALTAVEEDAGSSLPTLGFAAPFAFGNVFLTIMGSLIINLM